MKKVMSSYIFPEQERFLTLEMSQQPGYVVCTVDTACPGNDRPCRMGQELIQVDGSALHIVTGLELLLVAIFGSLESTPRRVRTALLEELVRFR